MGLLKAGIGAIGGVLADSWRDYFYCDDFSNEEQGFNISPYDLLIGLEPCDATEHIIRQSLKYNKPFEIALCYTAHKALVDCKIKTREDWYNYLKSISSEIKINRIEDNYIATNN